MKRDPDSHTSSRSLTHLAGNLKHKPATRNDHTAQPETEPALNRFVLKPLALRPGARGAVRPTFSFAELLRFTAPGRCTAAELIGAEAVEEVLGVRVGGEISGTSLEVVAG